MLWELFGLDTTPAAIITRPIQSATHHNHFFAVDLSTTLAGR